MKKQVLIIAVLALFTFSCSDTESELQTEETTTYKAHSLLLKELNQSQEFQSIINGNKLRSADAKSGNENSGVMFVQSAFATIYFFVTGEGFALFGGDHDDEQVKLMPDGSAQFSTRSTNPYCSILDFGFNTVYSNDCLEKRSGNLNVNVRGQYVSFEIPDIGTLYFLDFMESPATANVFHASNIKVNNQGIYDMYGGLIDCGEATEEYSVHLKNIFSKDGHVTSSFELK